LIEVAEIDFTVISETEVDTLLDLTSFEVVDLAIGGNLITGLVDMDVAIDEAECVEDWDCSEWSECAEGVITRTCEDKGECDTEISKPEEETSCGCEGTNDCELGSVCREGECLDDCGVCSMPYCSIESVEEYEQCMLPAITGCEPSYDCLIRAVENDCSSTSMLTSRPIAPFMTSLLEIQGQSSDGKCIVYNYIEDVDLDHVYFDDFIQDLIDDGEIEDRIYIDEEVKEIFYDAMNGRESICKYDPDYLIESINIWKSGGFSFSFSCDIGSGTCILADGRVECNAGNCMGDFGCQEGESCVEGSCAVVAPDCETDEDCEEGFVCKEGVCAAEQLRTMEGTKVTLEELDTLVNIFRTKIMATEDFSGTEVTVYTILYGLDENEEEKVLVIKSEKIEEGLELGEVYVAFVGYLFPGNVVNKRVMVLDKLPSQGMTVNGELEYRYDE